MCLSCRRKPPEWYPDWGIPARKGFRLRVCLRDAGTLQPRPSEPFRLGSGSDTIELTTDIDGCLVWSESLPYSHLSPERYFSFTRTISGGGRNLELRFAVDPWREGADAVYDSRSVAPNGESFLTNGPLKSNLFLGEEASIEMHDLGVVGGNGRIDFHVVFQAATLRLSRDQAVLRETLPKGRFQGLFQLARKASNGFEVLAVAAPVPAEVEQGRLDVIPSFRLRGLPVDGPAGQLYLLFRLEPSIATAGITPAEGSLRFERLNGKITAVVCAGKLDSLGTSATGPALANEGLRAPGFTISRREALVLPAQGLDPRTYVASAKILLTACLVASSDGRPLLLHPVSYQLSDTSEGSRSWAKGTTDAVEGCLHWDEDLPYDYAGPGTYIKKLILVRSELSEMGGVVRAVSIYIDPWRKIALPYWDASRDGEPTRRKADRTAVDVVALTHVKKRREISVDRYLQLTFRHVYRMVIRPELYRPESLDPQTMHEPVRAGTRYLLRGMFLAAVGENGRGASNLIDARMLSGFETQVEADGMGRLIFEVPLQVDFPRQALLEARNELVLDVMPLVDGGVPPRSISVRASFKPLEEEFAASVAHSELSAEDLIRSNRALICDPVGKPAALRLCALKRVSPGVAVESLALHTTANPSGGKIFDLAESAPAESRAADSEKDAVLQRTGLTAARIESIFNGKIELKSLLADFVALYSDVPEGDSPSDAQRAAIDPQAYVRLTAMTLVEDAVASPLETRGRFHVLTSQVDFVVENSETDRDASGEQTLQGSEHGSARHLGLDFHGNGETWHRGYNYRNENYRVHERASWRDSRQGVMVSKARQLFADELELTLRLSVRKCLLAELRPGYSERKTFPPMLFCLLPHAETRNESWFYVTDVTRTNVTSHLDPKGLGERDLIKLVRGKKAFADYERWVTETTRALVLEKSPGFGGRNLLDEGTVEQRSIEELLRDGGVFPGVLGLEQTEDPWLSFDRKTALLVKDMVHAASGRLDHSEAALALFFSSVARAPEHYLHSQSQRNAFMALEATIFRCGPQAHSAYVKLLEHEARWVRSDLYPEEAKWLFAELDRSERKIP